MLPGNRASTVAVPGGFLPPDDITGDPLTDYEMGGAAVGDISKGFNHRLWIAKVVGDDVWLQQAGSAGSVIFAQSGITEMSFGFDLSMRPTVAFVSAGVLWLRWYDPLVPGYVFTSFGEGRNPKVALDDKRAFQIASGSDVIFAYIRGTTLYYRQHRDRYEIERALLSGVEPSRQLRNLGLNTLLRLQFDLA
jgi:hypothetical protein